MASTTPSSSTIRWFAIQSISPASIAGAASSSSAPLVITFTSDGNARVSPLIRDTHTHKIDPRQLWCLNQHNNLVLCANPSYVLDIDRQARNHVILWKPHGGVNQIWEIQPASSGYQYIGSPLGVRLTVDNGGDLWAVATTEGSQLWQFIDATPVTAAGASTTTKATSSSPAVPAPTPTAPTPVPVPIVEHKGVTTTKGVTISAAWSQQPILRPFIKNTPLPTVRDGPSVVTKTKRFIRCPDVGSGPAKLRIVCISDTHARHHDYKDIIPYGDVLIHSGDFTNDLVPDTFVDDLTDFSNFFAAQPHRYKLCISGNHERDMINHTKAEIRSLLRHVHYLQDDGCIIEGARFWGSPWTFARYAFCGDDATRAAYFALIPTDTEIVITHNPPFNILDLAWHKVPPPQSATTCKVCGQLHKQFSHWGCNQLSAALARIKPKVHIFGHVHDAHDAVIIGETLYCNAAMDLDPTPIVFDYYYTPLPSSIGIPTATATATTTPVTAAPATVLPPPPAAANVK